MGPVGYIEAFQPGCRWWYGPDFLWQTEDQWPICKVGTIKDDDDKEVICQRVSQNTLAVTNSFSLHKLLEKFSSWPKLVRSVSWLKRFVYFIESKRSIHGMANKISLSEVHAASRIIIKIVPEELEALKSGRPVKDNSKLSSLCPILIDGAI